MRPPDPFVLIRSRNYNNPVKLDYLPVLSNAGQRVITFRPQNDENHTIIGLAKAIKQRKPYLNRDEGLDLLAIYNFLLGTRDNFNFCYSNVNLILHR